MQTRPYFTAIFALAAAGALAACSDQGPDSGDSAQQPIAAPSRSVPGDNGSTQAPDADQVAGPKSSEFAALDTNSDGELSEAEWQSDTARAMDNLKNMSFAQLDSDDSGGIDPPEFRKARTPADADGAEASSSPEF